MKKTAIQSQNTWTIRKNKEAVFKFSAAISIIPHFRKIQ